MDPLLRIEGLKVFFETANRNFMVLHGIDVSVARGEALGMVGESGSGKSVTWLAVLGLLGGRTQYRGSVTFDGTPILGLADRAMSRIRGRRIAMIFQDATSSLNPVHKIGRQIEEGLKRHRHLDGAAARAEALRLLDRVQIPNAAQRLNEYPHQLSGGMNQRVMIAIALSGQPELLIADEPTTALDATVQAQILALLADIRRDTGMAMVLISHDLGVVAENCERIAVMYAGRIVEDAATRALFDQPIHPYTRGLLQAVPDTVGQRRLANIPGSVPEPWALPPGCSFAPRCTFAEARCNQTIPPLMEILPGHGAACIRAETVLRQGLPVTEPA